MSSFKTTSRLQRRPLVVGLQMQRNPYLVLMLTLSMFYKKRFIRNTSLIPEINKKRGLVLLEKLRNASRY